MSFQKSDSIMNAEYVAPKLQTVEPKPCSISGCECEHKHKYSCPHCGAKHSWDCTCNPFDIPNCKEPEVSVADAIKFASNNTFTSLGSFTQEQDEKVKFDLILDSFFSNRRKNPNWRENPDISDAKLKEYLFYDATRIYYLCKRIPLDLNLQKAIQYYSELDKTNKFNGIPRYFCDHPISGLDTVDKLDSLIYEIIVYIVEHDKEFGI